MAKITASSLHAETITIIRDMIRKGKLRIGQKIIEEDMCKELGVSRTPLREALRSLSAEGLIKLIPNRGAFVSQLSTSEISELFEVMAILEGACARVLAKYISDESFSKLEALHKELEAHHKANDHESYIKTNNRYHTFVQRMTGNKTLYDVIGGLREKALLYRYRQLYVPDRFDQSIEEHRLLLEAFRKRDSDEAEKVMKNHLLKQGAALVKSISEDRAGPSM